MVKRRSPLLIRSLKQALVALPALLWIAGAAVAQAPNGSGTGGSSSSGEAGGPAEESMKRLADTLASVNGVAGSAASMAQEFSTNDMTFDASEEVNKRANGEEQSSQQQNTFGSNQLYEADVALPILKESRRIMDGKAYTKMVRDIITTELSTVFITMQMVENGAAQGFANAINMSQNQVGNQLSSITAKFLSLDTTDEKSRQRKRALAADWEKASREKGWLAGWSEVNGDRAFEDAGKGKVAAPKDIDPKLYAYNNLQKPAEGVGGTPGAGGAPNGQAPAGQTSGEKRLLSDILFSNKDRNGNGGAANDKYRNEQLDKLRQEFIDLVGDVEFSFVTTGNTTDNESDSRLHNTSKKPPLKGRKDLMAKQLKNGWESWFKLLQGMCNYKKNSGTDGRASQFSMNSLASNSNFSSIAKKEWPKITSPGVFVSTNLLEQAYTLVRNQRADKDVDCDKELSPAENKIPSGEKANDVSASNFNDCSKGKACLRNKVFYNLIEKIARGRVLETYDRLYLYTIRFAGDQGTAEIVNQLFQEVVGDRSLAQQKLENQQQYQEVVRRLGKLMQGYTTGSILRPSENESVAGGFGAASGGTTQTGGGN